MARRNQQVDPRGRQGQRSNQPLTKKEMKAMKKADKKRQQEQYAQEYYEHEAAADIEVSSLKKARKYNIIAIAFFILVVLICLFYVFFIQQFKTNRELTCWSYQVQVEQLSSQYVTVNGFSSNPAYIEDIPTFGSGPSCPSGGTYTWNPVSGTYTCSEHGHHPSTFAQPQSETKSVTEVQEINENAS